MIFAAVHEPGELARLGAVLLGVTVALLAPVTGVWVDAPHRRQRALGILTAIVVLLTSAMSLIRDDASYLLAGLLLLGFHRGVQRPGQRSVQRDAAAADDTGDVRSGCPDSVGPQAMSAAWCCFL
jgi:hypothetical protein